MFVAASSRTIVLPSLATRTSGDVESALQSLPLSRKSGPSRTIAPDIFVKANALSKTQGREPGDRVFNVPAGILRIMDRDLKLADIDKRNADGSVVHVHALRHSFGTHLSRAGLAPRVAQAAMRHSDIGLTMNTHTDARLLDNAEAVEALPTLSIGDDEASRTDAPSLGKGDHIGSYPDHSGDGDDDTRDTKKRRKPQEFTAFPEVRATRDAPW